jgi:hypothetical protein
MCTDDYYEDDFYYGDEGDEEDDQAARGWRRRDLPQQQLSDNFDSRYHGEYETETQVAIEPLLRTLNSLL